MIIVIKALKQSPKCILIQADRYDSWAEEHLCQVSTSSLTVKGAAGAVTISCPVPTVQTNVYESFRTFMDADSTVEASEKNSALTEEEIAVLGKHQFGFRNCSIS